MVGQVGERQQDTAGGRHVWQARAGRHTGIQAASQQHALPGTHIGSRIVGRVGTG